MKDPEIEAMTALAEALHALEGDAQGRVLRWAAERFGVPLPVPAPRQESVEAGHELPYSALHGAPEEKSETDRPKFEHFAELYNRANPSTDVERVLVAGYWFQAVRDQPSFQAAHLNQELKHLGHAVKHVTMALESNQVRKPTRIIQLRKSGAAKQARKTYKLTHEGLVRVQEMIAS